MAIRSNHAWFIPKKLHIAPLIFSYLCTIYKSTERIVMNTAGLTETGTIHLAKLFFLVSKMGTM